MDDAQGVREEIKRRNRAGKGVLIIIGSKEFRHGTGRSLIARTLAKAIGAKHLSTGDEFRQMARKKHMSINEYATYAEHHLEIDREFDEKTQRIIRELMNKRYFVPVVTRIVSTKERYGGMTWNVQTDRGSKTIITKGLHEALTEASSNRYFITDVDGNRYEIIMDEVAPETAEWIESVI